ncbi:hypothetical protein PPL_04567 [Heterostelium album PN500]|uniref:Uncharacterized protein n=1 Tax=Heterostelium pallidum (strain ATCC 26659 / Pp 5 / PN500) TaxID=670386 RepID=D3B7X9_HETP5|nr:hypothetical protein PPL_04567 [Heterostelium album PN500]EFA82147.1 hypothetical protein PPL_04567 [Heterostelium album PN500]|eukprot:XP_020434264.1 hypothetical protein PPL_04567 [Heterostelium album PN500]
MKFGRINIKFIFLAIFFLSNLIFIITIYYHSIPNIHTDVFNKIARVSNSTIDLVLNSTDIDQTGQRREYQGLKRKSKKEIENSFYKLSRSDKRFQFLLNNDGETPPIEKDKFNEFIVKNDVIYPIAHHFKTKFGNLPFHIAELNAKASIHENVIIEQHWYDIPHHSNSSLSSLKVREELLRLTNDSPMMDYVLLEYTGEESAYVLVWVLKALAPKVNRNIIIIGKDTYLEELEIVVDSFLESNKVFEVSKNILNPVNRNLKKYVTLLKLEKYDSNTPTFKLYNLLDSLNWKLDPFNQILSHEKNMDFSYKCNTQKFLVFNLADSFRENLRHLPIAISLSIAFNRHLLLDSTEFLNDPQWNLFLKYSRCSHIEYAPVLDKSNTRVYGEDHENRERYQFTYYNQNEILEGSDILLKAVREKFGFGNDFEYESALLNWIFRFSNNGRRAYRSTSFALYKDDMKLYSHPPQCIAMYVQNKKEMNKYLNALKIVQSKQEFSSITNVFLMTEDNNLVENINQFEDKSLKFQYLNYTREPIQKLELDKRLEQTAIMFTEVLEAAQCEIMIGSINSYIDRFTLQLSISKFKRPVFLYALDNSRIE